MKDLRKTIVDSRLFILSAVTIGGSLEWYEIGIFIFWPLIIENQSVGLDVSLAESLNTGAIFLLVALALANGGARAIGGWFFGKKGDEEGRKKAFPLTLLMATFPSWGLVLLSFFITYTHWLSYSTVFFALAKFFQGMPAGGELPGAVCYLSETAHDLKSRRFLCSFALLGPQIGLGLSALICISLNIFFPPAFLISYAWRYVFVISGLFGILGYMMRKKLHETSQYLEFKSHQKVSHKPLKVLFSNHFRNVILASILSIFEVVAFSVLTLAPYYYAKAPFYLDSHTILYLTLGNSCLCAIFLPLVGLLSSKFLPFPWLKISVWGTIISSPLLFLSLVKGLFFVSIILNIISIFLLSIQAAILPSLLSELFPINVRYTGIAFSFNICDGILWSAFTGICFLFLIQNSPAFVMILPFAALTFFIGIKLGQKNEKLLKILR